MKPYSFIFIAILIQLYSYNSGNAQSVDLSLQSGVSIPIGDFGSKDLSKGSFTLPGFTTSAQLKAVVLSNWGVLIQGSFQLNPIDVGMLGFERVQADPFLEDLYIRSDPFQTIEFSAGPLYKTAFAPNLILESHLALGLMIASTPYQLHKPKYFFFGPDFYEITPSTDYTFTYGGGITLNYQVTSCYSIGLMSRILSANANFVFVTGQTERIDKKAIMLWNNAIALTIKLH